MGGKYLFLFDRLNKELTVTGNLKLYYGCAVNDEKGLSEMAQVITTLVQSRIRLTEDNADQYRQEIFESLKCLDYTCIAEDFFAELETFGLILVSSFKDLPSSPRAVFH